MKGITKALGAVAVLVAAAVLLALPSAAGAATPTASLPAAQTVTYANGDYAVGTVSPVGTSTPTTALATTASYPCGYYGWSYEVKYHNSLGWVMWTYRSVFVVHVCNGLVNGVSSLYDEPVDTCCGWGWNGSIVRSHSPIPYTSAQSYTKGDFVWIKYAYHRYPWIKMTIGYNGGLWAYSWGIG